MVVKSSANRRRIGRLASNAENCHPSAPAPGPASRAHQRASTKIKAAQAKSVRVPGSHRVLLDSRRRISTATRKCRIISSEPAIKKEVVDAEMVDIEEDRVPTPPIHTARFIIPRHLAHPQTRYPSREALEAVGIDAKANLQYTRMILRGVGPQMLKVLSGVKYEAAPGVIPQSLDITVNDVSSEIPNYVFAAWPLADKQKTDPSKPTPVRFLPFHGSIVAANAANLPPLPKTEPSKPCNAGAMITVPIIPIAVPHPESLRVLLSFMYSKDIGALFDQIFPCPVPHNIRGKAPRDLVIEYGMMIAQCPEDDVYNAVQVAFGIWQNACYLGVFDDGLWATLDAAWEILLSALSNMSGALQSTPTDIPTAAATSANTP